MGGPRRLREERKFSNEGFNDALCLGMCYVSCVSHNIFRKRCGISRWLRALKKKPQVQNGVTYVKGLMAANQNLESNLTTVSTSPRNVTFSLSTWHLWSPPGNLLIDSLPFPLGGQVLPKTMHSLPILSFFPLPLCLLKNLSFSAVQWSSFLFARWDLPDS